MELLCIFYRIWILDVKLNKWLTENNWKFQIQNFNFLTVLTPAPPTFLKVLSWTFNYQATTGAVAATTIGATSSYNSGSSEFSSCKDKNE